MNNDNAELSLNNYCLYVRKVVASKGFQTPASIRYESETLAKLMLAVTEISEAAEAVRRGDRANFREEIADTFIRLMDLCGAMSINIEKEINAKMKKNEGRSWMHGKRA